MATKRQKPPCPTEGCRGHLVRKSGRFGDFLGCSEYPRCEVFLFGGRLTVRPRQPSLNIGHLPGNYANDDEDQEKPEWQRVEHKMAFLDPDNDDLAFQRSSKRLLFKDRLSVGLNEGNSLTSEAFRFSRLSFSSDPSSPPTIDPSIYLYVVEGLSTTCRPSGRSGGPSS
ncbi:topoisomerase DNA-binding C4 zinc finger domain-containing protein (plasmid) [Mesorhizobium atlanticum]|uniref:topoisomerase DNA-binding C4 zinc finger domain-containing protein n=1 Tax=Mesorhizobium atlanticum TaxID=2233532 RepID=UPI003703CE1A